MSSSDCSKDPRSDSLLIQPLSASSFGVSNLCTAIATQASSSQSNSGVPQHANTISGVRSVVFASIQPSEMEQSPSGTELLSELSQQGRVVSGDVDCVIASADSSAAIGESIRSSRDPAAVEPLSTPECSDSINWIQPCTYESKSLPASSNSEQREAASALMVPKIMIDGVLQGDDVATDDDGPKINCPEDIPLPVCVQVQLVLLGILHIVSTVSVAVLDFWASSLKAWMAKKTFSFIISLPSFGMAGLFSIFLVCCKRKAVGVLLCFTVAALLAAVAVCGLAAGGLTVDCDAPRWKRDKNHAARLNTHKLKVVCGAVEIFICVWQLVLILSKLQALVRSSAPRRADSTTMSLSKSDASKAGQARTSFQLLPPSSSKLTGV